MATDNVDSLRALAVAIHTECDPNGRGNVGHTPLQPEAWCHQLAAAALLHLDTMGWALNPTPAAAEESTPDAEPVGRCHVSVSAEHVAVEGQGTLTGAVMQALTAWHASRTAGTHRPAIAAGAGFHTERDVP